MFRKALVLLVAALMLTATAAAKEKLTVGIIWGPEGTASAGFVPTAEAFMELHPDVEIEFLWGTALGDQVTDGPTGKVLTMVAGGVSPDLVMVGGQNVPQYAVKDLLLPLDKYIEASDVNRDDFIPPAWNQTLWDGKKYAMTLQVDPNFALVWNKNLLAEAGLDTDKGPRTLTEWEAFFKKLTRFNDDGQVTRIGARPWDVYGPANTVFTWSWVFDGRFYDEEKREITAADPRNVEAVEFIREYHSRYNPLLTGDISFPAGGEAMRFAVTANLKQWLNDFPNIPLGIGFEPYKEGSGTTNPSWIGGWAMGVMAASDNPDLAWEFLRFMTATPEGTEAFARPSGWIPAYLRTPVTDDFLADPYMSVYLQIAQTARHVRPPVPVISDYMTYLGEALNSVLAGEKQPRDALQFVEEQIQLKLDEVLAGL